MFSFIALCIAAYTAVYSTELCYWWSLYCGCHGNTKKTVWL